MWHGVQIICTSLVVAQTQQFAFGMSMSMLRSKFWTRKQTDLLLTHSANLLQVSQARTKNSQFGAFKTSRISPRKVNVMSIIANNNNLWACSVDSLGPQMAPLSQLLEGKMARIILLQWSSAHHGIYQQRYPVTWSPYQSAESTPRFTRRSSQVRAPITHFHATALSL